MGRTIPSFRQLLEIEKLSWSHFKKELPTKVDRKIFDVIFENAELYASYLSNAVNHITLESVIIGSLFHNYKTLSEIDKENVRENYYDCVSEIIELTPQLLTENKPNGKLLFDRTCKKWSGLIDSLHKEDREILLKMILEICTYDECCNHIINSKDTKLCITYLFFISLIIQQQKLINRLGKDDSNTNIGMEFGKDVTLLDYMT